MAKTNKKIIISTLNIPLQAFGLDKLEKQINLTELNLVIEKLNHGQELSQNDYILLTDAFAISCAIAEEIEYQTLTGFSWNEAMEQLGICKMLSIKIE